MAIYSAADAALKIGCSVRTVQRIAERRHIGTQVGRSLVFTEADLPRLKSDIRPVGYQKNIALAKNTTKTRLTK